jgi:hypothetical protein
MTESQPRNDFASFPIFTPARARRPPHGHQDCVQIAVSGRVKPHFRLDQNRRCTVARWQ